MAKRKELHPDDDRPPRIYTVSQAARLLQVQEVRIRQTIHNGELKAARLGRVFRIREADLFAFIDAQTVNA